MKKKSNWKGLVLFYLIGVATVYACTFRIESLNNVVEPEKPQIVYYVTE